MIVTNSDRYFVRHCSRGRWPRIGAIDHGYRNPIDAIDLELFHQQNFRLTNDHPVRFRIEIDDIPRLRCPPWQTFALANGKHLNSVVRSNEVTVEIVNSAGMELVLAKMRTEECFVILSRHETNLLAVRFVGHS